LIIETADSIQKKVEEEEKKKKQMEEEKENGGKDEEELKREEEEKKENNKPIEERIERISHLIPTLSSPFNMDYTTKSLPFTNFVKNFVEVLDYILVEKDSSKNWRVDVGEVAPIPSEEMIKENTALPSPSFPSDHVPVAISLSFQRTQSTTRMTDTCEENGMEEGEICEEEEDLGEVIG